MLGNPLGEPVKLFTLFGQGSFGEFGHLLGHLVFDLLPNTAISCCGGRLRK